MLGLEAQRQAVHTFLGAAPHHEFTEVESGKRSDRRQLLRALDLAELSAATLIVAKLDRLSRDVSFFRGCKSRRCGSFFPTCLSPTVS